MSYMDYSLNKALNKNYFKIFSFTKQQSFSSIQTL